MSDEIAELKQLIKLTFEWNRLKRMYLMTISSIKQLAKSTRSMLDSSARAEMENRISILNNSKKEIEGLMVKIENEIVNF